MTKITAITSERIREHVMNASIWRLTIEETSQYLRLSGLPSNPKTVARYKRKIRESASEWISTLAKGKRGEYIAAYKTRADELEAKAQYERRTNECSSKAHIDVHETYLDVVDLSRLTTDARQLVWR